MRLQGTVPAAMSMVTRDDAGGYSTPDSVLLVENRALGARSSARFAPGRRRAVVWATAFCAVAHGCRGATRHAGATGPAVYSRRRHAKAAAFEIRKTVRSWIRLREIRAAPPNAGRAPQARLEGTHPAAKLAGLRIELSDAGARDRCWRRISFTAWESAGSC